MSKRSASKKPAAKNGKKSKNTKAYNNTKEDKIVPRQPPKTIQAETVIDRLKREAKEKDAARAELRRGNTLLRQQFTDVFNRRAGDFVAGIGPEREGKPPVSKLLRKTWGNKVDCLPEVLASFMLPFLDAESLASFKDCLRMIKIKVPIEFMSDTICTAVHEFFLRTVNGLSAVTVPAMHYEGYTGLRFPFPMKALTVANVSTRNMPSVVACKINMISSLFIDAFKHYRAQSLYITCTDIESIGQVPNIELPHSLCYGKTTVCVADSAAKQSSVLELTDNTLRQIAQIIGSPSELVFVADSKSVEISCMGQKITNRFLQENRVELMRDGSPRARMPWQSKTAVQRKHQAFVIAFCLFVVNLRHDYAHLQTATSATFLSRLNRDKEFVVAEWKL